ncbi:DnaB-like helicase C-terminal domain-containing protein [Sphingopyxis sp. NJF-3]
MTPDIKLPRNVEAEAALIGAMLIENKIIDSLPPSLSSAHFFEPLHGRLFDRILSLFNEGKTVTAVTLKTFFEDDEAMKAVGGVGYLARLTGSDAGLLGAKGFASQIVELAILRELIEVGRRMIEGASDTADGIDPGALIEEAEARLSAVDGSGDDARMTFSAGECAAMSIAQWDKAPVGVETGIMPALDEKLGVMGPYEMTVLAGRPGQGKTAEAVSHSVAVAKRALDPDCQTGGGVAFVSLEMSGRQLGNRMLSDIAAYTYPVPFWKIVKGRLDAEERERILRAKAELDRIPLEIIQPRGPMTIPRLRATVRRLKRHFERIGHPLRLLVVDYLQLMESPGRSKGEVNRVQEVSAISRGLKTISMEYDVHVMALSQLSRQVESREDKRPKLADLRESGAIEQDADNVVFVYRPSYYHEQAKPQHGSKNYETEIVNWEADREAIKDDCELIIAKCRNGEDGQTVHVKYRRDIQAFRGI